MAEALRNDSFVLVRVASARALGAIGCADPPVIDALIAALCDDSLMVRTRAARAFGELHVASSEAAVALAGLLKNDDDDDDAVALTTLVKFGPAAAPAVPIVLDYLRRVNHPYALWMLSEVGPAAADAVPVLVEILQDPLASDEMHDGAALALGRIGPSAREAIPALEFAIKTGVGNAEDALRRIRREGLRVDAGEPRER